MNLSSSKGSLKGQSKYVLVETAPCDGCFCRETAGRPSSSSSIGVFCSGTHQTGGFPSKRIQKGASRKTSQRYFDRQVLQHDAGLGPPVERVEQGYPMFFVCFLFVFVSAVACSRGTLPKERGEKGYLAGGPSGVWFWQALSEIAAQAHQDPKVVHDGALHFQGGVLTRRAFETEWGREAPGNSCFERKRTLPKYSEPKLLDSFLGGKLNCFDLGIAWVSREKVAGSVRSIETKEKLEGP